MLEPFESYFMSEKDYLRLEAMDLFERCLTEGIPDYLMVFIEQQIVCTPPRLDLLNDMAEDLRGRLVSLREVRDQILKNSQGMTKQLREDVAMTERLFDYLVDWTDALTVSEARRYSTDGWNPSNPNRIH